MAKLSYHTTIEVWLELEDYYHNGLTPEEVFEKLDNNELYPQPAGFNHNWIVRVTGQQDVAPTLLWVGMMLDRMLAEKKEAARSPLPPAS